MSIRSNVMLLLPALAGCAANYQRPTLQAAAPVQLEVPATQAAILRAASFVLTGEGNTLAATDEPHGRLSTVPRNQRVLSRDADCGTGGVNTPYLDETATTTTLIYHVTAVDGSLKVSAEIGGVFVAELTQERLQLTCVSRGTLERDTAEAIRKTVLDAAG